MRRFKHALLLVTMFLVPLQCCWALSPLKLYRDIYFAENSYALNERQLKMIGAIACSTIASNAPVSVRERNAAALAKRRLRYVTKVLIEHGVPQEHVIAESKADRSPVADEKSRLGQAKNRHIEIEGLGFVKPNVCRSIPFDDPPTHLRP